MNYLLNFNLLFFIKNFKFLVLEIIRKQEGSKQCALDSLLSELQKYRIGFEDALESKLLKNILCGQNLDWLEKGATRSNHFNEETLKDIV